MKPKLAIRSEKTNDQMENYSNGLSGKNANKEIAVVWFIEPCDTTHIYTRMQKLYLVNLHAQKKNLLQDVSCGDWMNSTHYKLIKVGYVCRDEPIRWLYT